MVWRGFLWGRRLLLLRVLDLQDPQWCCWDRSLSLQVLKFWNRLSSWGLPVLLLVPGAICAGKGHGFGLIWWETLGIPIRVPHVEIVLMRRVSRMILALYFNPATIDELVTWPWPHLPLPKSIVITLCSLALIHLEIVNDLATIVSTNVRVKHWCLVPIKNHGRHPWFFCFEQSCLMFTNFPGVK